MQIRRTLSLLLALTLLVGCDNRSEVVKRVESLPSLVAYWDFQGEEYLRSKGNVEATLRGEQGAIPALVEEGPVSGRSLRFDGDDYLYIPYAETGGLNVQSG